MAEKKPPLPRAGRPAVDASDSCGPEETPYLELRVGGLRLTLQRRPVRLLTAAAVFVTLLSGAWAVGGGSLWP